MSSIITSQQRTGRVLRSTEPIQVAPAPMPTSYGDYDIPEEEYEPQKQPDYSKLSGDPVAGILQRLESNDLTDFGGDAQLASQWLDQPKIQTAMQQYVARTKALGEQAQNFKRQRSRTLSVLEQQGYDPNEIQQYLAGGGKPESLLKKPKTEEEERAAMDKEYAEQFKQFGEHVDERTGQLYWESLKPGPGGVRPRYFQKEAGTGYKLYKEKPEVWKQKVERPVFDDHGNLFANVGDEVVMDRDEHGAYTGYRVSKRAVRNEFTDPATGKKMYKVQSFDDQGRQIEYPTEVLSKEGKPIYDANWKKSGISEDGMVKWTVPIKSDGSEDVSRYKGELTPEAKEEEKAMVRDIKDLKGSIYGLKRDIAKREYDVKYSPTGMDTNEEDDTLKLMQDRLGELENEHKKSENRLKEIRDAVYRHHMESRTRFGVGKKPSAAPPAEPPAGPALANPAKAQSPIPPQPIPTQSKFVKGGLYKQNGRTYQFDGTQFIEVK